MSYCRWSTDDFKCDIYAYGDASGGYAIHVAGSRHTIPYEEMKELDWKDRPKYMVPIGLPYDGQTFHADTLLDFKAKMIELGQMGYHFPLRVLGTIQEEIDEEQSS